MTRQLEALSRRIERWRAGGRRGKRMPAGLWESASELAAELGCYRVSRELRLNYGSLRERVSGRRNVGRRSPGAVESAQSSAGVVGSEVASFAEVDLNAVFDGGPSRSEIEIWRADGMRMRIGVSAESAEVVAAAVSAFVGKGS